MTTLSPMSRMASVPLGGSGGQAERWLEPTYPLDWHTDLIEVVDLVTGSGPADRRMQPALDKLADAQLQDGSWPLRVTFPPADVAPLEQRSKRKMKKEGGDAIDRIEEVARDLVAQGRVIID